MLKCGTDDAHRYIEVVDDRMTGEVLLDEALKMMKVSERMSIGSWVDLMSGQSLLGFVYFVRRAMCSCGAAHRCSFPIPAEPTQARPGMS
jgi:hypothetical protein